MDYITFQYFNINTITAMIEGRGAGGQRRGAIFYNFLVVISLTWNWEFLYKKILSGSTYYGLASEVCKPEDNILIPCARLQLGADDSVFRSGTSSDTLGEHGWTSIRHREPSHQPRVSAM